MMTAWNTTLQPITQKGEQVKENENDYQKAFEHTSKATQVHVNPELSFWAGLCRESGAEAGCYVSFWDFYRKITVTSHGM